MWVCSPASINMPVVAATNEYTKDVVLTVGIFSSIEDAFSQDAVLHRIFSSLVEDALRGDLGPLRIVETVVTLYRLYFADGWSPARTFFYMLSGILLNRDDPRASINEDITQSLYDNFDGIVIPILDPRTITGECDKYCSLLNQLWFDSDSYYDNAEEESETGSEVSGSEEESEEEMPSDHSVASVGTDDGVVDPRHSATPQWNSDSDHSD